MIEKFLKYLCKECLSLFPKIVKGYENSWDLYKCLSKHVNVYLITEIVQ